MTGTDGQVLAKYISSNCVNANKMIIMTNIPCTRFIPLLTGMDWNPTLQAFVITLVDSGEIGHDKAQICE